MKYTRELESAGLNSEQAEKIVRAQIDMITTSVATKADLKILEARMDVEFAEIRNQFKDVYRRFEDIDRRFEDIDRRFEDIDRRFDAIDSRFDAIDSRFDAIDRRFEGVDSKMDSLENRITFKLTGVMVLLLTVFSLGNKLLL